MIILDSNLFIYLSKGRLDSKIVADTDISHASVTRIEALGYPILPVNELLLLNKLFEESYEWPLTDAVVGRAVTLRQARRMTLGDSIIAATALESDCELWTANDSDFQGIENLKVVNPLSLP